jgi:predicted nucleic acid-binding protein
MTHLIILDNEAVQALADPAHRKHRQALAYAQVVAIRKRRAADIETVVPTTVRVEAGWDRTSPTWTFTNRLRITDSPLDPTAASTAAAIRTQTSVSVTDAHIGAVIYSAQATRITIVTSDPADMRQVAGDKRVTIAVI